MWDCVGLPIGANERERRIRRIFRIGRQGANGHSIRGQHGAGNEENYLPYYHPKFGLDEASLALGWQLMVDVARHGEIFRD